jgi:hypothetical protein
VDGVPPVSAPNPWSRPVRGLPDHDPGDSAPQPRIGDIAPVDEDPDTWQFGCTERTVLVVVGL